MADADATPTSASASGSPSAVSTKHVEYGEASRLPDTSWLWRRVLIFAVAGVMLLIAFRRSEAITDLGTIRMVLRYSFGIIALCLLLYGVGATITDVIKLMTAFFSTKRTTETKATAVDQEKPK